MAFGYLSKSVNDVSVLVSSSVGGKDEDSNLFAYFWRIDRSNIVRVKWRVSVNAPNAIELINERVSAQTRRPITTD